MNSKRTVTFITVAVISLYIGIIIGWHLYTPSGNLDVQAPGADNRPEGTARNLDDVIIGERFMQFAEAQTSNLTGKWIQFRGEKSDNIIVAQETINTSGDDYPIMWTLETGEGYAAPVIYNGKAYFLDYIQNISSDALRCFELETGKELWRRYYRSPMKRNHGFSRTVPVIGEGYIITVGPMGHVMACDPETGDLKWTLNMQKEFGSKIPQWYSGQCPLVDGNTVILAPAGDSALLAGLNVHTGDLLWKTPNTVNYTMSHSSVMLLTISGKKMYVYVSVDGVCGISAEEYDRGTLLWDTADWSVNVAVASPVQIANNRIFVTAGYNNGGAVLQIDRQGSEWRVIVEKHRANAGLSSEQQTPVFYNNMLISTLPKSAGATVRERLAIYLPTNLRTPVWISDAEEVSSLLGPYMVINNHLFLFTEDGELFVYEILQQSMQLTKRQRIMEAKDAFGPLAYADGILILGDEETLKGLRIN